MYFTKDRACVLSAQTALAELEHASEAVLRLEVKKPALLALEVAVESA